MSKAVFKLDITKMMSELGQNTYLVGYDITFKVSNIGTEDDAKKIAGMLCNAINANIELEKPLVV